MNFIVQSRNQHIVDAIVLIILGALMCIFTQATTQVFVLVSGIAALVFGTLFLIAYFATFLFHDVSLLLRGLFLLFVGAWILSYPGSYLVLLIFAISLFLLYSGIEEMAYAVNFASLHVKNWWVDLLASLIDLGCGIALLVVQLCGGNSPALVSIFAGASLILEGIMELILVFALHRDFKKISKVVSVQ